MGSTMRRVLAALGALSLYSGLALAWDVVPEQEYAKYIDKHRALQPLDSSPFGEQVNLRDGAILFRVTDIELPGVGPPIRLVRSLRIGDAYQISETSGNILGDWELEIPRIKTITSAALGTIGNSPYGWQVAGVNKDARCSSFGPPGYISFSDPARHWDASEWWSGYQVVDSEGGQQDVLRVESTYPELSGYAAVTTGNWRFSCLSSTANGVPGEAFLATDPEGTRYWFNYLVYNPADTLTKALWSDSFAMRARQAKRQGVTTQPNLVPENDFLERQYAALLVTRIEDRFGNWLTYQYSNGSLTRIDASDGRLLEISKTASQTMISINSGVEKRTWTYSVLGTGSLSTVALPDGSSWTYDFGSLSRALPLYSGYTGQCDAQPEASQPSIQGSATSPSGLSGTYTFAGRRFGRSYVDKSCWDGIDNQSGYAFYPLDWVSYALTQRTFSGPGIATQSWAYSYSPAYASWADQCATGCVSEVWTDVTAPDGTRTRSTFSNKFNETENLLLREETYNLSGTLFRTVRHSYATYPVNGTTPYAWPSVVGADLAARNNQARSQRWAPAYQHQIEQQGRKFVWQVPSACTVRGATTLCFDAFARPIRVTKSSAALP